MLTQVQSNPTRGDNVLDLCSTTLTDQIKKVKVVLGISDHNAVVIELDSAVKYSLKQPRYVYMYKKGDIDGVQKS